MDLLDKLPALVAIFAGFTVVRIAVDKVRTHLSLRKIPGPPVSSYLWGEEWELYHSAPGSLYTSWHKRYGPVVRFSGAFGHQILTITDPRAISFILSEKTYSFPKARGVRAWFEATVGKGILWIEDELTNNEHRASSFYMRALFWIFPSILQTGRKGAIIQQTKKLLGEVSISMWQDAKAGGDRSGKSLMAQLLRIEEDEKTPIGEEELVSQMRSIISAGYEPVSATLSWILYELSVNQHLQQELREEVATLTENSMGSINALRLLDAVIKETLRIHPPISENHHEAGSTISIPLSSPLSGSGDTEILVPEGTVLAIPLTVIHRDQKTWGPDANAFRPKRWFDIPREKERQLMAFSEGPHTCLGRTFAVLELKIAILTLISQFKFRCDVEIEEFQSFVVRPRVKEQTTSSLPLMVSRV
ncbi:hypothetical protein EST38_g8446 [Candolleomyces aberdarensis]|uniref:Cytochrome P450 n=1 Tax=Candolleomyces aberdarensis TaxID=2316362 RepID=A0A4Q2DD87_9AGAR|nr:hypothetical protein EST38_g8446 [Candolleomyces aberdarensis]